MKTMKFVVLLLLFSLGSSTYTMAYDYAKTKKGYFPVKWAESRMPLSYYLASGTNASSTDKKAIIDLAFAVWSNVRTTTFSTKNMGTTPISVLNSSDGYITVYFFTANWPYEATLPTKTVVTYDEITGEISDVDIAFNSVNFQWSTSGESGRLDFFAFAVREVGHALGLLDSADPNSSMYANIGAGDVSARTLSQDDIDGVTFLYQDPNPPAAPPAPTAGSVILPYLLNYSADFESFILIQNITNAPISANVAAYTSGGTYAGTKAVTIPANGRAVLNPVEPSASTTPREAPYFGTQYLDDTAYFAVISSASIANLNVLGFYNSKNATNSKDLILIQPMTDTGDTLYFPHFASNTPYETYLTVVNLNASATNIKVEALDINGNMATRGFSTSAGYGLSILSLNQLLQKNGTTYVDPTASLKLSSESGSIVGQLLFFNHNDPYGDGSLRESVGAAAFTQTGATSFTFPYLLATAGWESYLLFSNTGDTVVNYTLTGRTSGGADLGQVPLTIQPRAKAMFIINQTTISVPGDGSFAVRVTSDSTNLRGVAAYVNTTEMDFVIVPAMSVGKTLYSAFCDNSGLKLTYLQVANLGAESTTLTIKAYNDNGEKVYEGTKTMAANTLFFEQVTRLLSGYSGSNNIVITSDKTDVAGIVVYFNNSSLRQTYSAAPFLAK